MPGRPPPTTLSRAVVLCTAVAAALAGAAPAQAPAPPPALVVVVSVDQLAREVLDAALPHLAAEGGFRRLLDHGASFEHCAYRHGCTETGPGHATIATGAPAAVHGIVGNEWLDPATGRKVYCATSPDAQPVGGGVAGRGPGTLRVPTLGDALKQQVDGSRVVSLSLKDRSAILLAGASADLALWLDQQSGRFVTSSAYTRVRPAWLDRFESVHGLHTYFGALWTHARGPAAYADLVDDRPFEGRDPNGARTLPQRVDGGLAAPGPAFYTHAYTSPFGNRVLVDLARAAIDAHELGADDTPDLLCIGFSAPDAIGHQFGPQSVEVRDALIRLDRDLEDLLRTLDARVGRDRWALLLSADHGVAPAPEARVAADLPGGRNARALMLVRSAAERALQDAHGEPGEGHARFVAGVTGSWLYLDYGALDAAGVDPGAAAARAAAALVGIRGIRTAIPAGGDAPAADDATDPELLAILAATASPGRSGDVWLVEEPYWLLTPSPTASHGSPWRYDREVPLIAYGRGLRRGVRVATPVTPGTVAVLAAALLGIEPPPGARDPLPTAVLR